jgi:hypothetical protein
MRDFPSQYGRSEQYRNPEASLPFPVAKEIPRPVWVQQRLPITWTGPTPTLPVTNDPVGLLWEAVWESPWYDLRPDLRSTEGQPKIGVPIWDRAARLYVEMVTAPGPQGGISPVGFSASFTEYAENLSLDPGQTVMGAPGTLPPNSLKVPPSQLPSVPVNVTSTFFPATPGTLYSTQGVFSPPGTTAGGGDGYPIRYWKIRLGFSYFYGDIVPPVDGVPPLNIQAAYY